MARHMQVFYAIKTLRKVIKEMVRIKKLAVTNIISKSVIIKLLSELPDNLENIRFIKVRSRAVKHN
jgi:hypothetical protein